MTSTSNDALNHKDKSNEIDMMSYACSAQQLGETPGTEWIKIIAPAKINLHLDVGNKTSSGYHEVKTILHSLSLHDVVYVRRRPAKPGSGLSVHIYMITRGNVALPEVESEENIAYCAVVRLAECADINFDEEIDIRIEKNIPCSAGLGGGSSDAAAALVGVCRLWNLDPKSEMVLNVAQEIGSDVVFFLFGGCASFNGKGDDFVAELTPMNKQIVLVKPEEGVSTKEAYETFDQMVLEEPELLEKKQLMNGSAQDVVLYNNLAYASEQVLPKLKDIRLWLEDQPGVESVLLCGSGSTTFAVCDSFDSCCRIVSNARKNGWWARSTTCSAISTALVL